MALSLAPARRPDRAAPPRLATTPRLDVPSPAHGGVLGVVGAPHLAERLARAAAPLGWRVQTLDEVPFAGDASRPCRSSVLALARCCDVITAVSEHVPAELLAAAAAVTHVRPAPSLVALAQDRASEKRWLDVRVGDSAPWRLARSPAELAQAVRALWTPAGCWVKPCLRLPGVEPPRHVRSAAGIEDAWAAFDGRACVVEAALPVVAELVVLVARAPGGVTVDHPVAQTVRVDGRVAGSTTPAPIPPQLARKAQRLAAFYAGRLALEGILAVELFVLDDGRLVVNEMVPGPHPAFDDVPADVVDQYAQLARAVTGSELRGPAALAPASVTEG